MKTRNVPLLSVLLLVSTAGFGLAQKVAGTVLGPGGGALSPLKLPGIAPMQVPAGATFYTVQQGLENMPPLPFNPFLDLGLPVYFLGGTGYLVDDRTVDYRQLEAERIAAEILAAGTKGLAAKPTISLRTLSALYDGSGASRPYLTNLVSVPGAGATVTVRFDIAGGTNFVPYDIVTTTNVADPVSSWAWVGLGYTAGHYAFTGQPAGSAFYALVKPVKTSVIGWGNNTVGQLDLPAGLGNAVSVVAGGGQSLALRSDGTAVAWGQNGFGQGTVPANLTGLAMLAAGWQFDVALRTNGTVTAWGYNAAIIGYALTNVPANLTNARVVSAQALHTLALRADGSVVAWGYDGGYGETQVPAGLTNLTAIAAGYQHNLAVRQDGTVAAWGNNASGQCTVPSSLSNVWDVAAGIAHSLALRRDGTVVAWGGNTLGESQVPAGLSNVVAIAAGGDPTVASRYSLALTADGRVVAWGTGEALQTLAGLSNVVALAAGADHALAVRTGPIPPSVKLQRTDQFQLAGGTAIFIARGEPFGMVRYQWQFQGADLPGATNLFLVLSNVQTANEGTYRVVVANAVGSVASPDIPFHLVTPPVIVAKSPATNPTAYYQGEIVLGVTATAPGQTNGFPLSYQWRRNGTNILGAVTASYGFAADRLDPYSVTVGNLAGSTSTSWQVAGLDYSSLPYYLATNTAAYAAGRTGSVTDMRLVNGWTYALYTAANMQLLTNATWSLQCWLSGVKGLSATPIGTSNNPTSEVYGGQTTLTMVSPRHYLSATHVHIFERGLLIAFLGTNNVVHWRRAIGQVTLGDDIDVGLLDSDLPPSVGFLPLLAPGSEHYLPHYLRTYLQGIGMNQDLLVFGQPIDMANGAAEWDPSQTVQFGLGTNWNVLIRGGDSSLPERLLIHGQLILVSQHEHVFDGPNLAFQFSAINQAMHSLSINLTVGTDYQLTPYVLTNWPSLF